MASCSPSILEWRINTHTICHTEMMPISGTCRACIDSRLIGTRVDESVNEAENVMRLSPSVLHTAHCKQSRGLVTIDAWLFTRLSPSVFAYGKQSRWGRPGNSRRPENKATERIFACTCILLKGGGGILL